MNKEMYKKKGYWDFEVMSDEEFDAYMAEEIEKLEDDKEKEIFPKYVEYKKKVVRGFKLTKVLQIDRKDRSGDKTIVHFIIGEEHHNPEAFETLKKLGWSSNTDGMYVAKGVGKFEERLGQILEYFKSKDIIGREDKKEIIEEEYRAAYRDISGVSNQDFWEEMSEEYRNAMKKECKLGKKEYCMIYESDSCSSATNSGSFCYSSKLKYVIMK